MALDATRANQILDAIHGNTALLATTTALHLRLMTAAGSATVNGTELASGGSYVIVTGLTPLTMSTAASQSSSNSAISQTNMPATTITSIEVWDSNATPKRQVFGTLTASKTTAAGDTLSFAAAAITSALT